MAFQITKGPHPSLSHSLRSQERVSYAALTYRGQPEQCSRLGEDETLRRRGSHKEEHPYFGTVKTEIQSEGFDQLTMASTSPSPASAASGRGRGEGAPCCPHARVHGFGLVLNPKYKQQIKNLACSSMVGATP